MRRSARVTGPASRSLDAVERDELGREVRHPPPPGYRQPDLDDEAWPIHERRRVPWVRVIGVVVAVLMLVPILINTIAIALDAIR